MQNDKIDRFYDALKADGALENVSRGTFRSYVLAPKVQGYKNRLSLYNALKADGALENVNSYEDFSRQLIHAVSINKPTNATQNSTPRQKQQAQNKKGGSWSMVDHPTQTAQQRGGVVNDIIDNTQRQWKQGGIKTLAEFNKGVRQRGQKYQVPQEVYDKTKKKTLVETNGAKPNGYLLNSDTGRFEPAYTDKEDNVYFDKHEADIVNDYQNYDPYYLGLKEREKGINKAVADYYTNAYEKYRNDVNNYDDPYKDFHSFPGLRASSMLNRLEQQSISHMTHYDLQTMMDNVYKERGKDLEGFIYNQLVSQQPNADKRNLSKDAKQIARQYSDRLVYEYAKKQNAPKNTLDFFWRKVYDGNMLTKLIDFTSRKFADGKVGDKAARDAATEGYNAEHGVVGAMGTAVGMGLDPTMLIGSQLAKGGVWLASRGVALATARKYGVGVGARLLGSTTLGKYGTSALAGALNLGFYEGASEGLNQLSYGGKVDLSTGKVGKYDAGAIGNAALHGSILGIATGATSHLIGNIADTYVKSTSSVLGKTALRSGELVTSALAEGTIFASPEIYDAYAMSAEKFDEAYAEQFGYADEKDKAKRDKARAAARNSVASQAWISSLGTMVGFKAHGLAKGALGTIRDLVPYRNPRTAAERTKNRLKFSEIISNRLDKGNNDLSLTEDEKRELQENGYGTLKDLLVGAHKVKNGEKKQQNPFNHGVDFDPFKSVEDLSRDRNVCQATKAKVQYYLTGVVPQMKTVTSYNRYKDKDGRYIVETYTLDGDIVTRKYFDSNKESSEEVDRAKRQVELNTISIAETQKENAITTNAIAKVAKDKKIKQSDVEKTYILSFDKKHKENFSKEENEVVNAINAEILKSTKNNSPEVLRNSINERYRVNINRALKKSPSKRSEQEKKAIDAYISSLTGINLSKESLSQHLHDTNREQRYNNALNAHLYSNSEYAASSAYNNYANAARSLAQFLGISVDDVDKYIDKQQGQTYSQLYNEHVADYTSENGSYKGKQFAYLLDRLYESYAAKDGIERNYDGRKISEIKSYNSIVDGYTRESGDTVFSYKDKDGRDFALLSFTGANSDDVCFIRYFDDNSTSTISRKELDKCEFNGSEKAQSIKDRYAKEIEDKYNVLLDRLRNGKIVPKEGDKVVLSDGRVSSLCEVLKIKYGDVDEKGNPTIASVVIKTGNGSIMEYGYTDYQRMLRRGFEVSNDRRISSQDTSIKSDENTSADAATQQTEAAQQENQQPEETFKVGTRFVMNGNEYEIIGFDGNGAILKDKTGKIIPWSKSLLQSSYDKGNIEIIEDKPAVDVAEGMTFTDVDGNKYKVVRITDDEVVIADEQGNESEPYTRETFDELVRNEIFKRDDNNNEPPAAQGGQAVEEQSETRSTEKQQSEQPNEQPTETPTTPQQSQDEQGDELRAPMPMKPIEGDKQGRMTEDWLATTPERGYDYLTIDMEFDASETTEYINAQLSKAEKRLKSEKKKKANTNGALSAAEFKQAKEAQKAHIASLQAEVDYWKAMKKLHNYKQNEEAKKVDAQLYDKAVAQAEEDKRVRAEKEAEQTEVGSHAVNPKLKAKWNEARKEHGKSDEIVLPNGEVVKGHYVLVESGAPTASHQSDNGFSETEGFPIDEYGQNVNDRDYKRDEEAQRVTRQMADNYDQRAVQSPVVVSKDGIVLSGNGRTMAGEIAARQGTDTKYNDYIRANADKYGFTEEHVSQYKHPRIVFVTDAEMPYDTQTFAKFNQREQKSQSKTENAVKMGKVVDDNLFGRVMDKVGQFETLADFYTDDNATHAVVKALAESGVIPQTEMAALFDGGKLSEQGQALIENILIGKVFESNPDAVREITEVKSVRKAVMNALQTIVTNNRLGGGYSLSDELSQAIDLVYKARQAGYKVGDRVSDFARQGNLFEEDGATVADYRNAAIMMLADVLNDSRVTQLKKVIAAYNERAEVPSQGIEDMFVGKVSKEQIINEIRKAFNYGQSEQDTSTPTTTERQSSGSSGSEQSTPIGTSYSESERGERVDKQGNPINEDGTLKVEQIKSVDELTDEDFSTPTRNVQLPQLPQNVDSAIGAEGNPVVIKKNIFEKNWNNHKFPFDESRLILQSALYNTDLVGQTQPTKRPLHWVAIKLDEKSPIVVLEVSNNKDNVEIVGWYTLDDRNLQRIKRQAEKNGGELVILSTKDKVESLSTPQDRLSSADKDTNKSNTPQEYTYQLTQRPYGIGSQPEGQLRHIDDGSKFGSVVYDHPLSAEEVKNFSLTPITEAKALEGRTFEVPFGEEKDVYHVDKVDDDGTILYHVNDEKPLQARYHEFLTELGDEAKEVKAEVDAQSSQQKEQVTSAEGGKSTSSKTTSTSNAKQKGESLNRDFSVKESAEDVKYSDAFSKESELRVGKSNGKSVVKVKDFLPTKKEIKEKPFLSRLNGVHYRNGFAFVSNGGRLIAIRCDYPAEYEGKTINEGKIVEGEYPNVNNIMPAMGKMFNDTKSIVEEISQIPKEIEYVVLNGIAFRRIDISPLIEVAWKAKNVQLFLDRRNNLCLIGDGVFGMSVNNDDSYKTSTDVFWPNTYDIDHQRVYLSEDGTGISVKEYFESKSKTDTEIGGEKIRYQKASDAETIANEYGVNTTLLSQYAEAMSEKNSAAAMNALHDMKVQYLKEHREEKKALMEREGIGSLLANSRLFAPILKSIKEQFGDADALVQERIKQAEQEHNMMQAARKRAEEEARKREARLEELVQPSYEEIDKQYADALAKGDEATAREMLNEAARRKGYGDADSDYQGVGAWVAPSDPGYESDEARRNAVGEDSPDLNVADMAAGYSNQPEDIFEHPNKYSQGLPTSKESGRAIQNAIDAIRSGKKDVRIKVYRAVPTSVKEGKLRNGDWVTPSRRYAEMHGDNRLEGKYRIIEDEVPANELWWDSNDVNEWGYDNGKDYRYKNTKNNRKLNDLITRDDKGNIIPPSKRFNSLKADERYQKTNGTARVTESEAAAREAVTDLARKALGDDSVINDWDFGQRVLDEENERVRLEAKKRRSAEAEKRNNLLHRQDLAFAYTFGMTPQEAKEQRQAREREYKTQTKDLYERVLSGNFDDVTLQLINDFVERSTPLNPYGRYLSKRLPPRVGQSVSKRERTNSIDVLFSRISESAVRPNERTRPEARRRIEEKKKELLKAWAIATGNWHTSVSDFTDAKEPLGSGKDSDVYVSKDGKSVIKVSKGKDDAKRFRPDIDNAALFNSVFPNSKYEILGYGEIDGKFVRFLRQPIVDFTDSTPLSVKERVAYMERLGFRPMNDEKTAFTNGTIIAADVQKNNIVKDKNGNIRVIDADMRLHTKDLGGKYTYPPVETDTSTSTSSETIREQRVYHGSGADFDHFDHSHMGEGEGAQVYGWGTYVTEVEGIGRTYAHSSASQNAEFRKLMDDIVDYGTSHDSLKNVIENESLKLKREERSLDKAKKYAKQESLSPVEKIDAQNKVERYENRVREVQESINSHQQQLNAIAKGLAEAKRKYSESKYKRHLYTVEIPDDNRHNYLDWANYVPKETLEAVKKELKEYIRFGIDDIREALGGKEKTKNYSDDALINAEFENALHISKYGEIDNGQDLYNRLKAYFGSQEEASRFLSNLGLVGIKYPADYRRGGRFDEAKNYVIFNETDAKITDHIRYFRTPNGEAYGFTLGGKIYIDPRVATAETPIHEYSHLWATAMQKNNPAEWEKIVGLMKGSSVWEEVKKTYPELTDDSEIADEVLAHYSGRRGAERLREEIRKATEGNGSPLDKAKAVSALQRIKVALDKFWKGVADFLHIHYTTAEEVADRVMKDLLDGVDPRKFGTDNKVREQFIGERGAKEADHAEEVTTRLDNLSVARDMEAADKGAKAIKLSTGWERGADGKWRYEIPEGKYYPKGDAEYEKVRDKQPWSKELDLLTDRIFDGEELSAEENERFEQLADEEAKFKAEYLTREKPYLADWLKNDALFKAYPDLKSVEIVFTDSLPEDTRSYYSERENKIVVNTKSDINTESIIAHEVQHAIQHIEGFARGGSPESIRKQIEDYIRDNEEDVEMTKSTINSAFDLFAKATKLEIVYPKMINSDVEWQRQTATDAYWDALNTIDNGFRHFETEMQNDYSQFKGMSPYEIARTGYHMKEAIAELKRISDEYTDSLTDDDYELKELVDRYKKVLKSDSDATLYRKLGGEVEARNVQNRMPMSPEERRQSLASETEDVSRDDQIFLFGEGGGYSAKASEEDKNEKTPFTDRPNRANEKSVSGSVLQSIRGDSSSNATTSKEADAKVIKATQSAKNKIQKYSNNDYTISGNTVPKAISELANMFSMRDKGGSKYVKLLSDNGETIELRLANHKANGNNFAQDDADQNVSVVIETRVYNPIQSNIEYKEYVYSSKDFNSHKEEIIKSIVKGVDGLIKTGEYTDESGFAKTNFGADNNLYRLKDGTFIKSGSYFSGGGLLEEGLKRYLDPSVAVEFNEKISGVYADNFGNHIVTADVRDVDPRELAKKIDGEVQYFHASPVCKNYSRAKREGGEVELDKETAQSTADFISAKRPKVVTIENVKGYKNSEALKIITDELTKQGYDWDMDVYNAADYGGYTKRERLIVRAVRDGKLPEKPQPLPESERKQGWWEAVEDLIADLPEKKSGVADWMDTRLKGEGIDYRKIDKPLYVFGQGNNAHSVSHAFADELIPTLRTKGGDVIIMPDGRVLQATPRVLARLTGLGDDYKMPETDQLAHTIVGNGIPTQLSENVIGPLLDHAFNEGERASSESMITDRRNNDKRDTATRLTSAMHLDGSVEVLETNEGLEGRKRNAKGWYDPRTGKITVVLGNHESAADVQKTIFHEAVAHKGLRTMVGEENFDTFIDNVYGNADERIQTEVDRLAEEKYNGDKRVAMEEYMAKLAEDGEFMKPENKKLFDKVKDFIVDLLKKAGIDLGFKLTDNDIRYMLWRSYKNLTENVHRNAFEMAEDAKMREKFEQTPEAERRGEQKRRQETLFRDGNETIQKAVETMRERVSKAVDISKENKADTMRDIGGNLTNLRRAMSAQRAYDMTTVRAITDLTRDMIKHRIVRNISESETKKLLSIVNNVHGKGDIRPYVNKLMDLMVTNVMRSNNEYLGKLLALRRGKINASGVKTQGLLDAKGQKLAQYVWDNMSNEAADVEARMAEVQEKLTSKDKLIADDAAIEYEGLQIAKQYIETIKESKKEEKRLLQEMNDFKEKIDAGEEKLGERTWKSYVDEVHETILQVKAERAEAYQALIDRLSGQLGESAKRAKQWQEENVQRVKDIYHNANSDMEGRSSNEHTDTPKWAERLTNNPVVQFFTQPLATFADMLRMFGQKNADGRGYLFNRFVPQVNKASAQAWKGYEESMQELNAKIAEIYGKKGMTMSKLMRMAMKKGTATVYFMDGNEMKPHQLTVGNMLYVYMVNKMADGRMKLRKMGISETDVNNIANQLDTRLLQFADWVQNEYLVKKRAKYNEVHERMFGAPMDAIENYFPFKLLKDSVTEETLGATPNTEDKPTTKTGAIIKRTRNSKPFDLLNADAFELLAKHIKEMEHWSNYAELCRDISTLLNYKRFKAQVKNMNTMSYGSGEDLWRKFVDCANIAADTYKTNSRTPKIDKLANSIAKGVTLAKISFRFYTALKQLLSLPAYVNMNPKYLIGAISNPYKAFKWSLDNMPSLQKRWGERFAGDPLLLDTTDSYSFWKNNFVQTAMKWGMSPNAFIDVLTISVGSYARYNGLYNKYLKYGYNQKRAHEKAVSDAEIFFNETQQSAEGSFLSPLQKDNSWLSSLLKAYRNSAMAYTRKLFRSVNNIKHYFTRDKEVSLDFMAKQFVRDGINEEQAKKNAKSEYNETMLKSVVDVAIFGFVLQLFWNAGSSGYYYLFGNDDEDKKKTFEENVVQALFGGFEGLTGGDIISQIGLTALSDDKEISDVDEKKSPLMSDVARMMKKSDGVSALNDVINILVQSAVGANPETLSNWIVALIDRSGADENSWRENSLLISRIFNVPQSQTNKTYMDEIQATIEEGKNMSIDEILDRYAKYKKMQQAPLTYWLYDEDSGADAYNRHRNTAKTQAVERINKYYSNKDYKDFVKSVEDTKKKVERIKKLKEQHPEEYMTKMQELAKTQEYRNYYMYTKERSLLGKAMNQYLRTEDPKERAKLGEYINQSHQHILNLVNGAK